MTDDVNADLIGYEMDFEDGSAWQVVCTDDVLGTSYVRIEQTNAAPGLSYTPQRIQNAHSIRQRREAEMRKAGQAPLFDGPS